MATLSLTTTNPARISADAVVVGLRRRRRGGPVLADGARAVDQAYTGDLTRDLQDVGARGELGEVVRVPARGRVGARVVAAVGLGESADLETLRQAAGAAARALAGSATVALALPGESVDEVAAVAEGALLGAYSFAAYRNVSAREHRRPVRSFQLAASAADQPGARDAIARAKVVARSVHLVRDLVNTSPSQLHPQEFADTAEQAAAGLGLEIEVLDDEQLREGGYGGLTAVGMGSAHGPRLVRVAYRHPDARSTVALVGKGITFDSGGLSLKPPQAMEWMKADMGGAAAVLGTVLAAARLQPAVDVTGWLALAENMPSGTAQRPGDVITIYGGRTVEVLNTDAEGRLVLADAIVRAAQERPDVIVDVATLTGAQIVALGARTAGIMSTDDDLRDQVHQAAQRAGEAMWPMPLPKSLRASLDSTIADIKNIGDKPHGGMLTAGLFLADFVAAGQRWAHLDIAGPAYNDGPAYGYTTRGGTGAAVRTLLTLVEDFA